MNFSSVGKHIRKYRTLRKLRQEELAEKIGVSVNYIGQIERGEKTPAFDTFISIANVLNVSSDMLLCDVITAKSYEVKDSLLHEKLCKLSDKDRARIYDVIDTLIKHSVQVKP
ncbi:MAG: helix-turn-helix transcriptional regulator [Clostridia bacterium]|nr:helix-turn-helix transcriptional regulator [Clostridia bacterium]